MGLYNSNINAGYGRSMSVAARNAITERFGGGSFASQAAHNDRAKAFIDDCKKNGIRSFDQVTKADLQAYGERLSIAVGKGEISINTAQNRLSTANIILEKTNKNDVKISPSGVVGERNSIRTEVPTGLDKNDVAQATTSMRDAGFNRAASVTELAREFGVREREASCADLNRWSKEAEEKSAVNVIDACKGGRNAPSAYFGDCDRLFRDNPITSVSRL